MSDKTVTVKLSEPLPVGEEKKTELIFLEPSLGDIIDAEDSGITTEHKMTGFLLARMCGASLQEVRALSVGDYLKCEGAAKPLLGKLAGGTGGE